MIFLLGLSWKAPYAGVYRCAVSTACGGYAGTDDRYPDIANNMTGHCDIAPDRKPIPVLHLIGHGFVHWSARDNMTLFTTLLVLIFERLFKLASTGSLIIVLKRSFGG